MKIKILREADLDDAEWEGLTILDTGMRYRGHKVFLGSNGGDVRELYKKEFLRRFVKSMETDLTRLMRDGRS